MIRVFVPEPFSAPPITRTFGFFVLAVGIYVLFSTILKG
jgi:hypothetical protein